MNLDEYIAAMPKVELHVHLEGAIQPETLLLLARRNNVKLPHNSPEALRHWYRFTGFPHFVEIYLLTSSCICTPDDIELVAQEFLRGQAAQRILYTEATYTPYTHYSLNRKIPFADQIAALERARQWGMSELGVQINWVLDISRNVTPVEHGLEVAGWAISAMDRGVVALGLGGPEVGNPPEAHREAFERALAAGLASVPHAGETVGPESIWGALNALQAQRLGHGVRCLEDPELVKTLRERRIPLEVCPTSNICLRVFPAFEAHPLPRLLAEGLFVTLNSDDPPMFNTSLTQELQRSAQVFGLNVSDLEQLTLNAAHASLLPASERALLERNLTTGFENLRSRFKL